MCLVIDTCCLGMVFDKHNKNHLHFAAVLDWVVFGKGRMIYGGTKYNRELRQAYRFLGIVSELKRSQKAIEMPTTEVDIIAEEVKVQAADPRFDDEHIAALVILSRCCVVCTNDGVAISNLKRPELFSDYGMKHPKIYSSKRNQDLCCNQHLVAICLEHR